MNMYTMILVSFPLDRCVDDFVNNRANYQG